MLSSVSKFSRASFTLIELLIVLAIVAILSVVVILTLNPSELLKQSRDSTRLSDLSTLNTSLSVYNADVTGGFMGTSSVVYVSIPDTTSTCASLGLPTLPTGWSYNCVTSTSTRLTNGTGWIPVNFTQISFGSPLSNLPIDPLNTTSSGNYYTYVSGGSWILTAIPESAKQKAAYQTNPSIPNYPGVIGIGSNLSLSPLYNPSGLVGYWKFDEGSGNTTADLSGNGNKGTFAGTAPVWVTNGKIGGALRFSQANQKVTATLVSSTPPALSVSFWFNADSISSSWTNLVSVTNSDNGGFLLNTGDNQIVWYINGGSNTTYSGIIPKPGQWYHVVGVYDGTGVKIYVNGIFAGSNPGPISLTFSYMQAGNASEPFSGMIDDVRYYTRMFSAAEILALYNATK